MNTLFLDTASGSPCLALCEEYRTPALKALPKQGENKVIPILEEALKEAHVQYDSLTHVACVTGPGGFVSLRIGVTAANTLAWSLQLPLAGIHLSDLRAARVMSHPSPNPSPSPNFYWLHSTRRTQLFVRGFGMFQKQFPEPTLIDLGEAMKLHGGYVGELIEEHRGTLTGCTPLEEAQPLAAVLPSFLRNLQYTKQLLLPWYGREA